MQTFLDIINISKSICTKKNLLDQFHFMSIKHSILQMHKFVIHFVVPQEYDNKNHKTVDCFYISNCMFCLVPLQSLPKSSHSYLYSRTQFPFAVKQERRVANTESIKATPPDSCICYTNLLRRSEVSSNTRTFLSHYERQ